MIRIAIEMFSGPSEPVPPLTPEERDEFEQWKASVAGRAQSLSQGEECEECGNIAPDWSMRPKGGKEWVCPDCKPYKPPLPKSPF